MPEQDVDVVRRMLAAFNEGDVEAVVSMFAEDCSIEEPPEMPDSPSRGYRGHDGIHEWMANLRGVAQVRFEQTSVESAGEQVLMELESRGRGEASGVPIQWTTFAVADLHGGKITRIRVFLHRAEALAAAGLPG